MEFSRTLQGCSGRPTRSTTTRSLEVRVAMAVEEGEAVALDWERIAPDGVDGAGGGRRDADLAAVGNVPSLPAPPGGEHDGRPRVEPGGTNPSSP